MPRPSIEMKPSMSVWSRNSAFTPLRLPSSSSPTVPTNITSPTVAIPLALMDWINDSNAASPRESSPMPGARMTPSFSFTVTSVPSGNTVSRCAETTSFGLPLPEPLRNATTLPSLSIEASLKPSSKKRLRKYSARIFSLYGGAGISVMRFCSANALLSSALMSSSALIAFGFARMAEEAASIADPAETCAVTGAAHGPAANNSAAIAMDRFKIFMHSLCVVRIRSLTPELKLAHATFSANPLPKGEGAHRLFGADTVLNHSDQTLTQAHIIQPSSEPERQRLVEYAADIDLRRRDGLFSQGQHRPDPVGEPQMRIGQRL